MIGILRFSDEFWFRKRITVCCKAVLCIALHDCSAVHYLCICMINIALCTALNSLPEL